MGGIIDAGRGGISDVGCVDFTFFCPDVENSGRDQVYRQLFYRLEINCNWGALLMPRGGGGISDAGCVGGLLQSSTECREKLWICTECRQMSTIKWEIDCTTPPTHPASLMPPPTNTPGVNNAPPNTPGLIGPRTMGTCDFSRYAGSKKRIYSIVLSCGGGGILTLMTII